MAYKVFVEEIQGKTTTPTRHVGVAIRDGVYGFWVIPKECKDDKSEEAKKNWEFVEVGGAVYVRNVITDIDTMKQTLSLYFDSPDGQRRVIKFPREDLNENKIQNLVAFGVQCPKKYADKLIQVIENQEIDAERILEHSSLGFAEFNGDIIFKGAEAIGVNSTYNGNMRITPKGDLDIWLDMVETEVIGHTPLEAILSIGVAGMIADYLKDDINVENVLCHLIGESSSGKTTASLLMVSMGSAPDFMGDNFAFSFTDTLNSLMRCIPSSYPVLIDEGSVLGEKDFSALLYTLSSGNEKRRLNSSMEIREMSRFRTAIAMTSEKSILSMCNENSGLLIRNMEFNNVTWTKDAKSSDTIKNVIKNNYGHIILLVAEFFLKIGKEKLIAQFDKEVETIIEQLKESNSYNKLTERTAKQYGLVMLGSAVLKKVLKLDINKSAIRKFLLEHSLVSSEEQVSLGKRAIDFIKMYISKHKLQFITEATSDGISSCRGRLQKTETTILPSGEESTLRLLISKNDFDLMLREGRFSDSKVVLKELKELGYLVSQKDRYVSDIKIVDKIQVSGYVLQIPTVEEKLGWSRRMKPPSEKYAETEDDELSFDDEDNSSASTSVSEYRPLVKAPHRKPLRHFDRSRLKKYEDDNDDDEIEGLTAEQNEERIRRAEEKIRENRKDYKEREEEYEYVE